MSSVVERPPVSAPAGTSVADRVAEAIDAFWSPFVACVVVLVTGFLLIPLVIVVGTSFNAQSVAFPPPKWSLGAYSEIAPSMWEAFGLSIQLGVGSVTIALLIGIPLALALVRSSLPLKGLLDAFFRSPLQIPAIVTGVALYQYYVLLGTAGVPIRGEFSGLLAAHVLIIMPFVLTTLVARVAVLNPQLEEASYGLGAGVLRTTLSVTLPLLRPAIVAGGFLAFLVSFDDVAVSLFLVTTGTTTLPVNLLFTAEQSLQPSLYAVSTLIVAFSVTVAIGVERFIGLRTVLSR